MASAKKLCALGIPTSVKVIVGGEDVPQILPVKILALPGVDDTYMGLPQKTCSAMLYVQTHYPGTAVLMVADNVTFSVHDLVQTVLRHSRPSSYWGQRLECGMSSSLFRYKAETEPLIGAQIQNDFPFLLKNDVNFTQKPPPYCSGRLYYVGSEIVRNSNWDPVLLTADHFTKRDGGIITADPELVVEDIMVGFAVTKLGYEPVDVGCFWKRM